MVKVDLETAQVLHMINWLQRNAAPELMRKTLNRTADAITREMQRNIRRDMVTRSKFTLKSTENRRVKKYKALNIAMGNDIDRMFSRAGTYSTYLWKQEEGGHFGAASGGAVPIPTLNARIRGDLRRSVAKKNRLSPGSLDDGPYGSAGDAFIGTPKGEKSRSRGLYKRDGEMLIMLRDLESEDVKIKPLHFLGDAIKRYGTNQFIQAQFLKAAREAGING